MSRFLNRNFELLEPYDAKVSCTVLRGESSRKGADLLDNFMIHPGASSAATLSQPEHLDYLVDLVRDIHTNHLGTGYDLKDSAAHAGGRELQKALGYRFVIPEASYTPNIKNRSLRVILKTVNTGSTPIYEKYPLEISLIDPRTGNKIWSETCKQVDCRTWMPGDAWNRKTNRYELLPDTNLVDVRLKVHAPDGEYLLAVTLADPYSSKPAVRFALDNYLAGGYTILGRIGVNRQPADCSLEGIAWDDISAEKLIH
jgi:hypothetical protein